MTGFRFLVMSREEKDRELPRPLGTPSKEGEFWKKRGNVG
jgi:hypothetical protein